MEELIEFLDKYSVKYTVDGNYVIADNINLFNKGITKLPESIGNLKCNRIWLNNNQITELPESISNIKCKSLWLHGNKITKLPESFNKDSYQTLSLDKFLKVKLSKQDKVDWDRRFIELSEYIGDWSKDRSHKVGAVIVNDDKRVVSMGYNGFLTGMDDNDDERHERPAKYDYTEHAEANAIHTAARNGVSVKDCTIYLKWFPCVTCCRAIIQSGISKVVCCEPDFEDHRWGEQFKVSHKMFIECNVELKYID